MTEEWKPLPPEVSGAISRLAAAIVRWEGSRPVEVRLTSEEVQADLIIFADALANGYRMGWLTLEVLEEAELIGMPRGYVHLCGRFGALIEMRKDRGDAWWQAGEKPPEHEL